MVFTPAGGGTSGTLTLTSGGASETLTLIGSYVTGIFKLSSDTKGGTLIAYQVAPAGPVLQMANAMAAFNNGGTSVNAPATSASTAPLLAASH